MQLGGEPALRPGKIREMEPTTQRALELHMCGKWAERLLAHFAPFAEHIAYMQDILGEDFRKEALDLLGDSRFRTLRQHCLVYESLRKSRSLLNQLAGLLKIDELHRLKSKKSSLEEALTDTVTRPQRKAVVPSKEVIWALEEGAGYDRLGATGQEQTRGARRARQMSTYGRSATWLWRSGARYQPEPRSRQGTQEDLNHPDWADPLPPPAVNITDAGPEGREDQIEKEGEASFSVPSGSAPSARSWSVVEHEPGDTPVKAKDLFHPGPPPSGGGGGQT